ncbi:MAG: hypothetical protein ACP5UM_06810, partial [Anaerolineae bacterium]
MTCCVVSLRSFPDGPVRTPVPESDPVNIAWALSGHYLSFYTVRRLSDAALVRTLAPFDPVIVALDREDVESTWRVVQAASGQVFTYSEGHIWDYQTLPPVLQVRWVEVLRRSHLNLIYWEKYLPFYRALSPVPVAYLPFPYLVEEARARAVPLEERPALGVVPTGLAGRSRNGLADVLVARHLREEGLLSQWLFCLDDAAFQEDAAAILALLGLSSREVAPPGRHRWGHWRAWLVRSGVDYRPLLRAWDRLRRARGQETLPAPAWWPVPEVGFLRRTRWDRYLPHLAQARLLVDLNNRETVGRNALDCAALGVACVSTPASDLQPVLFPET